jgi:XapX domain-containing protein
MIEAFQALAAGALLGFLFDRLKLPLPAPPVLSGVMGIGGVLIGHQLILFIASKL